MNCIVSLPTWFFTGQSFQYVRLLNITTIHGMSHRLYYSLACSSRAIIEEPASYYMVAKLVTITQLKLCSIQFPTAMSDSNSVNSFLLEVIMSSQNKSIFSHDSFNHTWQMILIASRTTLNAASKRHILWNDSSQAPSW